MLSRNISKSVSISICVFIFFVTHVSAASLSELRGSWVRANSGEAIEFRQNGDVIDFRLGQGRFTPSAIAHGANTAIAYQGNRWCYYYVTMTADGNSAFFARRNPNQDPWLCSEGQFIKARP